MLHNQMCEMCKLWTEAGSSVFLIFQEFFLWRAMWFFVIVTNIQAMFTNIQAMFKGIKTLSRGESGNMDHFIKTNFKGKLINFIFRQ